MNKKGIFRGIIILTVLIIGGFFLFTSSNQLENGLEKNKTVMNVLENYMEESCVPTSCCHATSCINENLKPNCSNILCTMECKPGTMDCGAGNCKWNNGNCEVEWNE